MKLRDEPSLISKQLFILNLTKNI